MIRSILLGSLAIASATAIAPAGVAIAQTQPAAERAAITVVVPRPRRAEKSYTGIPIETLTAQSIVYIDDLDLTTPAGKAELTDRVKAAAQESCDWLDELYPLAQPDSATCVSQAMKTAKPQIDKALGVSQ